MEKEIRVSLQETLHLIKNMVNINYNLPNDRFSREDREELIRQIYYTYVREVDCNNKLHLRYINSALGGNMASWFTNTLSYEKKAPLKYREDVIEFIEKLFKERYEVVE